MQETNVVHYPWIKSVGRSYSLDLFVKLRHTHQIHSFNDKKKLSGIQLPYKSSRTEEIFKLEEDNRWKVNYLAHCNFTLLKRLINKHILEYVCMQFKCIEETKLETQHKNVSPDANNLSP